MLEKQGVEFFLYSYLRAVFGTCVIVTIARQSMEGGSGLWMCSQLNDSYSLVVALKVG